MPRSSLIYKNYKVLSFDCYGTLIDWASGILSTLRPILELHNIDVNDNRILSLYSSAESEAQLGTFVPYKEILRRTVQGIGSKLGFTPSAYELESLVNSLANWNPFPDTVQSLKRLHSTYKLAIISNIDDDLFKNTAAKLGVVFDTVVTSQSVGSYKPSHSMFYAYLNRIGVAPEHLLHVAQSSYHDIIPANELNLSTVWVTRSDTPNATPNSTATPNLVVPDLKSLVSIMGFN